MNHMEIYEKVRSVPDNAKKPIIAGRMKGKTDINPMWRIKILTELFGLCGVGWYFNVVKKWSEASGDEVAVFVDIELFVKSDGEWSNPIHGTGGNMFVTMEKNGKYVCDDCYKKATTDAISVACKHLGIGADVYWNDSDSKYCTPEEHPENASVNTRLKPVLKELERIGYTTKSICSTYKIDSIDKMSDLQIKDFLTKAKNLATKAG